MVGQVLGESFEGILVSNFYAAYHHYPGLKQRCWVHPRSGSGAGAAAGHSRADGLVPGRRRAGPVGIGNATALRQRPGMGGGRGTPSVPGTVDAGAAVAGAAPPLPGMPPVAYFPSTLNSYNRCRLFGRGPSVGVAAPAGLLVCLGAGLTASLAGYGRPSAACTKPLSFCFLPSFLLVESMILHPFWGLVPCSFVLAAGLGFV